MNNESCLQFKTLCVKHMPGPGIARKFELIKTRAHLLTQVQNITYVRYVIINSGNTWMIPTVKPYLMPQKPKKRLRDYGVPTSQHSVTNPNFEPLLTHNRPIEMPHNDVP